GRRDDALAHGHQREGGLDGAGGRQRVTDHRLVGGDGDGPDAVAEYGGERHMLHLVVFGRRGAVCVDVVDLGVGETGVGKGGADGGDGRRSVRLGARAVEIVGALAAAAQDAENGGAARQRAFQRFEDQGGGALGDDE